MLVLVGGSDTIIMWLLGSSEGVERLSLISGVDACGWDKEEDVKVVALGAPVVR